MEFDTIDFVKEFEKQEAERKRKNTGLENTDNEIHNPTFNEPTVDSFQPEPVKPEEKPILRQPSLQKTSGECPECKDTGTVKEHKGGVHTCWTCLAAGKLDNHSKNLPDSNIKL